MVEGERWKVELIVYGYDYVYKSLEVPKNRLGRPLLIKVAYRVSELELTAMKRGLN